MLTESSNTFDKDYKNDLPLFWKIHHFIFTKTKPSILTRIIFYIGLMIILCFLVWHTISLYVIQNRDLILTNKHINVEQLIICRGEQLGFKSFSFLNKLIQFHSYSIIIWLTFLGALILFWRKSSTAFYLFLAGYIAYFGVLLFIMNMRFFNEDITLFDKVSLSLLALMLIPYFLFSKIRNSESTLE